MAIWKTMDVVAKNTAETYAISSGILTLSLFMRLQNRPHPKSLSLRRRGTFKTNED